jgi:Flp pilus assembly protein TadD
MNLLRQALVEDSADVEARRLLAALLDEGGDTDEALALLTGGLALAAGQPRLLVARGTLLTRLGQYAEAEDDLRAATAADPTWAAGHLHLGMSLLRRGRHAEATTCLFRAATLDPMDPEAVVHLGEAWYHGGDLERAEEALRRATDLAPEDPRAWKLLGRLLDRLGRTEEAMRMHRKAREAGTP